MKTEGQDAAKRAEQIVREHLNTADAKFDGFSFTGREQRLIANIGAAIDTAVAEARRAERERAIAAVNAEEEMDGAMPNSIWGMCATRDGATEVMRAAVRVTKRNIIAAIGPPASAPEGTGGEK